MRTVSAVLTGLALSAAVARQPPAPPPAPAAFPPVLPSAARLVTTLDGLAGPAWTVACPADGGQLLAGLEDGTIAAWRQDVALGIRSGPGPAEIIPGHRGPVLAIAATADRILSGGSDGNVVVRDLSSGKPDHVVACGGPVRALAMAPAGKIFAAAEGSAVELRDATSGSRTMKMDGGGDWLLAVAFSPDGQSVTAGGYDGRLLVWDASSGKKRVEVEGRPVAKTPAPPHVISAVAFSPDGALIALGGSDGAIHLFQAADGKLLRSLAGHTATVTGLTFHPGGELLASSSKDRTVRLWNPTTGQLLKSLEGHNAWVQGITFFARGTRLASAGADRTVRVWDLTDPARR
jgi:WD40 repeat protein